MTTNYERIKAMSLDEMAKFLRLLVNCFEKEDCTDCQNRVLCSCANNRAVKQWLESGARND